MRPKYGLSLWVMLGWAWFFISDARADEAVSLPDTPVGKQAAALLKTIESQDRDQILAFVEKELAPSLLEKIPFDDHVQMMVSFAERTGGLVPQEIVQSTDSRIRFLARTRRGDEARQVTIEVEVAPAHRISVIGIMPPPAWSKVKAPPIPERVMTSKVLANYMHDYCSALAEADVFSGAVLVDRDGETIFREAFGPASRAWQIPNQPDTKFNLGSMNKMFTSISIAQLMEAEKLSLDDTVGKHLPAYPNQEAAEKVTIRQLLNHTSGTGDYFNDKFWKSSRDQFRNIGDFFPLFAEEKLQFTPGSRYQYSNGGFIVLGAIVEKASGQDYFDYVREHIYQPAGMQNTDAYEVDRDTPNLAVGYTRESNGDGQLRNNILLHVVRGGPAGGGYSTVDDLLAFAQALAAGKLVKPETLEQWTQPGEKNPQYGFGFEIYDTNGQRAFGHRGGFPGVSGMLRMDRNTGITVAILSNIDNGTVPVAEKLDELLDHLEG